MTNKLGESAMKVENEKDVEIKVVGIGKIGNSALNEMIKGKVVEADFVAVSEKQENLDLLEIGTKILITENFEEKMKKVLENTDMVFILAETDEAKNVKISTAVAKIAQSLEILTISIIAAPSAAEFEKNGKAELKQFTDIIITIPFEKVSEEINKIFIRNIKVVVDIIRERGIINLDFADVNSMLKNGGTAVLGYGTAVGENKEEVIVKQVLNKILSEKSVRNARKILMNIVAGPEIGLTELSKITRILEEELEVYKARIVWAYAMKPDMKGIVRMTLIATDFSDE